MDKQIRFVTTIDPALKAEVLIWRDYLEEHFPIPRLLRLCEEIYEAILESEKPKPPGVVGASGTIVGFYDRSFISENTFLMASGYSPSVEDYLRGL